MKTIGQKWSWVVRNKERRVLKLLRTHRRECDREFVAKCAHMPGESRIRRIQVEFAQERLSAFEPHVVVMIESKRLAA